MCVGGGGGVVQCDGCVQSCVEHGWCLHMVWMCCFLYGRCGGLCLCLYGGCGGVGCGELSAIVQVEMPLPKTDQLPQNGVRVVEVKIRRAFLIMESHYDNYTRTT